MPQGFQFASLFQDHAILQRDMPLPVWGRCAPHEEVIVTLGGHVARTLSNGEGRWALRLPPSPAGGPHELVAHSASASGSIIVRNVLFGEVWLCSGQSNMEWPLAKVEPPDVAEPTPALPEIALFTVENPARLGRQEEVVGRWQRATPEALAAFSAVAGWFGRTLHQELGVPVGLICNAVGGTRIEAWMSREALVQDRCGIEEVRKFEAAAFTPGPTIPALPTDFETWDKENRGLAEGWADPGFDDGEWPRMPVPGRWQQHGHPSSGVVWFRHAVTLPAAWEGRDLELRLGRIDKHDDTWVNGERVGGLSWEDGPQAWNTPRIYAVPARLIGPGPDRRVQIAVRARSHLYHGGLVGPADMMRIAPKGEVAEAALFLSGSWRYQIEQDWGVVAIPAEQLGVDTPNAPGILFESRIAPLLPFALRGVIWYQGEANVSAAVSYRRLMPLLMRDWRWAWGQGDFAFLQVQLANFGAAYDQPASSDWAELREAQAEALAEPHAGMAVAIDLGDPLDIHPRNKDEVGRRLARWALSQTYGRGGVPSGPLYDGMTVEDGGRVRIVFRHAAGLRTRDGGAPGAVAVAGADRIFVWGESRVEGETLLVWHPAIAAPAAVRYAWADNPEGCNLVNADGLPAAPFRTDRW